MRKTTETLLRNLAMLGCIPVYPREKSTSRIRQELRELNSDYDVTARSVQRSLVLLSRIFPIACETRSRTNYWYWSDPHALTQIPSMSPPTAFALRLAADYLRPIMPPSALRLLDPYFAHANRVLKGTALGRWPDKAAIIGRGPRLQPPPIQAAVQDAVYTALMENRKVEVAYRAKGSPVATPIALNPLGIVVREGIFYLVATSWNYDDVRQYVLHRMSEPRLLDEPARAIAEFSLAAYIGNQSGFSYPQTDGTLPFRALFDSGAGMHLTESRLGARHRTTEQADGRILVQATVPDTADLRWWLLGFGSAVEVLEPESLRLEMRDEVHRMRRVYE